MKNLKRVLSLGLASVMLLGMMVMGASAATFSDSKDIENDEAVNMMVSLNIINGKDDGRFDPTGTVTRGEMAKMITVALNGGVAPVLGTTSVSYTDTANHWAKNFIEYCTNLKIVSGRGNGTFDPNGAVTGSEAAKMILVAMGYQSDWFGFTGADWELNTNREANNATLPGGGVRSLYDGLPSNFNPSAALSRDDAAQMIYNGVRGETMEQSNVTTGGTNGTTYSYSKSGKSILNTKYNITTEYGQLTDVTYNEDDKIFTYTVTRPVTTGTGDSATTTDTDFSYDFADDVSDLFMQQVQVILNADGDVMGISSYKSKILASVAVGDLPSSLSGTSTSVKVNGTTYRFDDANAAAVEAYEFLNDASIGNLGSNVKTAGRQAFTLDLIDTNDNNRIDLVVIHPFTVAEVTYVGTATVTAGGTYRIDENNIYDGIKKGDWAKIIRAENSATNTVTLEKVDVITGTVKQLRAGSTEVRVDNTWYTANTAAIYNSISGSSNGVNKDYDLAIVNGYIFGFKAVEGASANIKDAVYVTKIDAVDPDPFVGASQRVELLFTDGTKKVVTVVEIDDNDVADSSNDASVGDLFTYKTNSDNNYELTSIDNDDFEAILAGDNSSNIVKVNDGKTSGGDAVKGSGTFYFADDAIVFVIAGDGSVANKTTKVLTGADVNKWSSKNSSNYATTAAALYANKSNGFNYTALGVLNLGTAKIPNASGAIGYGFLTADASYLENDDDEGMLELTFWNGTEEVTINAESLNGETSITKSKENNFKKGTIISYEDLGSTVGDVKALNGSDAGADAVIAYDGGSRINFETSTITEVNSDAVILYVDTADNEGVAGGGITVAQQDATTNYWVKNVYVYAKEAPDNDEIALLVVDTDNSLSINKDVTVKTAAGTYLSNVDDKEHTASYAANATIAQVEAEAEGWTNAGAAKVVKVEGNSDATNVEDNDVLHVIGTNGTDHYFTLTVAS